VGRRPWAALSFALVLATLGCGGPTVDTGFPDARAQDGGPYEAGADGGGCPIAAGGDCEGTVLSFCEGGQVMSFDCAEQSLPCRCRGGTCGCLMDSPSGDGGYSGTPDGGTSGGCGSVTANGSCSGDTVVIWCENSTLQQYDCSLNGAWCECDGIGCGCCDFYGCF